MEAVRALHMEAWAELTMCNEAAIALAFAVVKTRGSCPLDVLQMAVAAIKRTGIVILDSSLSDELKSQWNTSLTKMKQKLESLPPTG
jgi:hypothetical protein